MLYNFKEKKSPTQMQGTIKLINYVITVPEYTSVCTKYPLVEWPATQKTCILQMQLPE